MKWDIPMVALFLVGFLLFGVSFSFSRWIENKYLISDKGEFIFAAVLMLLWGAFLLGYWLSKHWKGYDSYRWGAITALGSTAWIFEPLLDVYKETDALAEGIVKWFRDHKGYGFIRQDDGRDIFVHYSSINIIGFKTLADGDRVSFEVKETEGGPQAKNVIKLWFAERTIWNNQTFKRSGEDGNTGYYLVHKASLRTLYCIVR